MVAAARILAMSDLNWTKSGTSVQLLTDLINRIKPDLVLLAGDTVDNDKGKTQAKCPTCWQELGKFLDFLEESKIQCYVVRGNWDEKQDYSDLMQRPYAHIAEISEKLVEFRGLKILGIPHDRTTTKADFYAALQSHPEPVDILLTHADGTRRMMLFEHPARLIITGHYDEKVSIVRGRAFVSFSQFPNQYGVINYGPDDIHIAYRYNERFRIQPEDTFYEVHLRNGAPTWNSKQAQLQGEQYARQMEGLLSLKEREPHLDPLEKREAIQLLVSLGVSKAQIVEHIPGSAPLLKLPKKTPQKPVS